jgi:hypothetical protein
MNGYEVRSRKGIRVRVEARNPFSAISKAHQAITGERATSKDVTWHGTHAECKGQRYGKPVLVFCGIE